MKNDYTDISTTKWWIKFLLLFKKAHFNHEHYKKYIYRIKYKKLFGKVYVIDEYMFGFC